MCREFEGNVHRVDKTIFERNLWPQDPALSVGPPSESAGGTGTVRSAVESFLSRELLPCLRSTSRLPPSRIPGRPVPAPSSGGWPSSLRAGTTAARRDLEACQFFSNNNNTNPGLFELARYRPRLACSQFLRKCVHTIL
jgi:hypothetical protein